MYKMRTNVEQPKTGYVASSDIQNKDTQVFPLWQLTYKGKLNC